MKRQQGAELDPGQAMRVLRMRLDAFPRGCQRVIAQLAGVNEASISRWRAGVEPRLTQLEAVAKVLRVSVAYFVSEESQEQPTYPRVGDERKRRTLERQLAQARQTVADLQALIAELEKE